MSNIVSPGLTTPLISWAAADELPGRGVEESFREEHDRREPATATNATDMAIPMAIRFITPPTRMVVSDSLHNGWFPSTRECGGMMAADAESYLDAPDNDPIPPAKSYGGSVISGTGGNAILGAIGKWNGILPQGTGGGAVPFIGAGEVTKR
jgi:hypothetical protein